MAESFAEQTKENVQPHVDEPIIAVGVLQPAGTFGSVGIGQISRIAGVLTRLSSNKKSGGLSKVGEFKANFALVAVTENKLHAFNAKPVGRQFNVQDPVGAWERSDLNVVTTKGTLSTKVVIDVVSTGEHYELESSMMPPLKGHNEAFLPALAEFLDKPGPAASPDASAPDDNSDTA